jgi:SOS-response transcriptional repressor LexA
MALRSEYKTLHAMSATTQAVFRKIVAYMDAHEGVAPTRREIASGVGIAEGGHVAWHLNQLAKHGLIVLLPGVRRGIQLPGQGAQSEPQAPQIASQDIYEAFVSQWTGA